MPDGGAGLSPVGAALYDHAVPALAAARWEQTTLVTAPGGPPAPPPPPPRAAWGNGEACRPTPPSGWRPRRRCRPSRPPPAVGAAARPTRPGGRRRRERPTTPPPAPAVKTGWCPHDSSSPPPPPPLSPPAREGGAACRTTRVGHSCVAVANARPHRARACGGGHPLGGGRQKAGAAFGREQWKDGCDAGVWAASSFSPAMLVQATHTNDARNRMAWCHRT